MFSLFYVVAVVVAAAQVARLAGPIHLATGTEEASSFGGRKGYKQARQSLAWR